MVDCRMHIYNIQRTTYNAHCTVFNVQCTVYTILYTLCSVPVYHVGCAVGNNTIREPEKESVR